MNLEPRSKTAPKIFTHFKSKGWLMFSVRSLLFNVLLGKNDMSFLFLRSKLVIDHKIQSVVSLSIH